MSDPQGVAVGVDVGSSRVAPGAAPAATIKALSLWQPWASLIALGVKTVETRSWGTKYRGPLAIHAAKTPKGFYDLLGDCDGKQESGWVYGYLGDYQASYCFKSGDEGTRGQAELHAYEHDDSPVPIPLGAVVATCRLVDVVPIIERLLANGTPWVCYVEDDYAGELLHYCNGETLPRPITRQLPYGNWTPGRYAWILSDVQALAEPIPAVGHQGLWNWAPPAGVSA